MFFAKGFEVKFAGILHNGSFFDVYLNGEHVFLHLVFFGGIEIYGTQ